MTEKEKTIALVEWFVQEHENKCEGFADDDMPQPDWSLLFKVLETGKKMERYYQETWKTRELE